jgi:cytochrome bd-type quinol oxidase subunit 2
MELINIGLIYLPYTLAILGHLCFSLGVSTLIAVFLYVMIYKYENKRVTRGFIRNVTTYTIIFILLVTLGQFTREPVIISHYEAPLLTLFIMIIFLAYTIALISKCAKGLSKVERGQ